MICFRYITGVLYVEATNSLDDSALARIQRMVNEAQMSSPDVQQVADKVASWFVPGEILLSALFCYFVVLTSQIVFSLYLLMNVSFMIRHFHSLRGGICGLVFAGVLRAG